MPVSTCQWHWALALSWVSALGFGLSADGLETTLEPFGPDALHDPGDEDAVHFLALLNAWLEMTMVLNELARSMGQPDFYPFVMSRTVVAKLQFIHCVVREARAASRARTAPSVPAAPEKSA